MKRTGNLYHQIYSLDNLRLADKKAGRGKSFQRGVINHMKNQENNIIKLHYMLRSKNYTTSKYMVFKIIEEKEREIFRLPYFPDRIVHHAIMNILESIFVKTFTADTYSCIKGKGIHAALESLKIALKSETETHYCLKLDIKKFYPNIDHDILKLLLRKKFKDKDLLWLLDDIIDSAPGVPIGNYLSQYFANFYLTYFDHWIKQDKKVKYYFRYADDLVILHSDKIYLRNLLNDIQTYFTNNLKLTVKNNYQIFPVDSRSIDFVGYCSYHTHTRLRKRIKKRFAKMLVNRRNHSSVSSYRGWTKHCNSKHLIKKLLK